MYIVTSVDIPAYTHACIWARHMHSHIYSCAIVHMLHGGTHLCTASQFWRCIWLGHETSCGPSPWWAKECCAELGTQTSPPSLPKNPLGQCKLTDEEVETSQTSKLAPGELVLLCNSACFRERPPAHGISPALTL